MTPIAEGEPDWPAILTLRDTRVVADEGQRIYSTATGYGYQKREYIRADIVPLVARNLYDQISPLPNRLAALEAENARLREALTWMVENDETNEGDEPVESLGGKTWNEYNAYWIDGLNKARAALSTKEPTHD